MPSVSSRTLQTDNIIELYVKSSRSRVRRYTTRKIVITQILQARFDRQQRFYQDAAQEH